MEKKTKTFKKEEFKRQAGCFVEKILNDKNCNSFASKEMFFYSKFKKELTARQVSIYLLFQKSKDKKGLKSFIARLYNCTHFAVLHSIKIVELKMKSGDEQYLKTYNYLDKMF